MHSCKAASLLLTLLLIAAFIPTIVHANGISGTITLQPSDDSFVTYKSDDSSQGNNNYGGAYYLEVWLANDIGTDRRVFIKFDLSGIPSGSNIVSAYLTLTDGTGGGGSNIPIYLVQNDKPWDEETITWNNKPSIASSPTFVCNYPGNPWKWDVKTDVQSFVSGSLPNNGWCLTIYSWWRDFVSKEAPLDWGNYLGPVLEVTYGPGLPVPEYAFGALLAVAACFAAFVIIKKPHLNLRIK